MSRAEELWKQSYIKVGVDSWEVCDKDVFIEMLHKYGAEVRKRDAEIAGNASPNGLDIGGGDAPHEVFEKTRKGCAAAIAREPLP